MHMMTLSPSYSIIYTMRLSSKPNKKVLQRHRKRRTARGISCPCHFLSGGTPVLVLPWGGGGGGVSLFWYCLWRERCIPVLFLYGQGYQCPELSRGRGGYTCPGPVWGRGYISPGRYWREDGTFVLGLDWGNPISPV